MKGLLLTAIISITGTAALSQQVSCAPAFHIMMRLDSRYQETIQDARDQDGVILEMWANPENGTWTFTARDDSGAMCILTHGKDYHGQTVTDIMLGTSI